MKLIILLMTLLLLGSCVSLSKVSNKSLKKQFNNIVYSYIRKYPEIKNSCNAKPTYKIYFMPKDSVNGFWVACYLGPPATNPIIPVKPGSLSPPNPIEVKGVIYYGIHPVVIYDYKYSDGYGLYEPEKVSYDAVKDIKEIDEFCGNVLYPEAWYFSVTKDSLSKTDMREPYKLK